MDAVQFDAQGPFDILYRQHREPLVLRGGEVFSHWMSLKMQQPINTEVPHCVMCSMTARLDEGKWQGCDCVLRQKSIQNEMLHGSSLQLVINDSGTRMEWLVMVLIMGRVWIITLDNTKFVFIYTKVYANWNSNHRWTAVSEQDLPSKRIK